MAGHLESLAWLWITLAITRGYGVDSALTLLRR